MNIYFSVSDAMGKWIFLQQVGKRDRIETILSKCRNLILTACGLIIVINEAVRYVNDSCPRKI